MEEGGGREGRRAEGGVATCYGEVRMDRTRNTLYIHSCSGSRVCVALSSAKFAIAVGSKVGDRYSSVQKNCANESDRRGTNLSHIDTLPHYEQRYVTLVGIMRSEMR